MPHPGPCRVHHKRRRSFALAAPLLAAALPPLTTSACSLDCRSLDGAETYSNGEAEEIMGEALKELVRAEPAAA